MHVVYASAGYGGVLFGIGSTVVQYQRVRRDGIAGVSLATWTLFVLSSAFWMTYGAVAYSAQIILGSLLVWPMQFYIVGRLSPLRHLATVAKSVLFLGLFAVAPIGFWGWSGGIYGMGIAMTIMRVPQIIELIQVRHAEGVSAGAWYAGVVCSLLWLVYYVGAHLWAPFIATAGAGLASLMVAVLATIRHAQARAELVSA